MTEHEADKFVPDKTLFKDAMGRFLTQSLFLELGYDTESAVYTLADEHKEYKGKIYPSLKRLYLLQADPTEYSFANAYLCNWEHWQRIKANKVIMSRIEHWEEELELMLRSQAVRAAISLSGDNFNASKWVADGSWRTKKAGRPKAAETERERKIRAKVIDETSEDASRILPFTLKEKASG